jgi:molybdate transport system substrate-binding protein
LRTRRWAVASIFAAVALAACGQPKAPETAAAAPKAPLVYAAASLTDVLKTLGDAYAATGQPKPDFSFASSSDLARQIEQGAQADVFLSADEQWMDYLDAKGLIDKASRVDLLGNRLVLVTPMPASGQAMLADMSAKDGGVLSALTTSIFLAQVLGADGKLAMGDPDAVPAGKYGRDALTALNAWSAVEPKLARAANVRDALRLVSSGEAAAGIVYATDAKAEPKVAVSAAFPETSHKPIVYPMALTAGRAGGKGFLEFLRTAQAKAVFEAAGFTTK